MAHAQKHLHRFAVLSAVAVFVLLVAGGLVTSTDSGLSVPDWPLSYGTWFPPMVGGVLYEHSHRIIAAIVGLMMLVLAAWLWKSEPRGWVRRLGYSALACVVLQGLLGGLTVLLLLPPQVSIAHACLGQAVFCLVVCLATVTGPSWSEDPVRVDDAGWPSRRLLVVSVALLAGLQLLLGAIVRHMGRGLILHMAGATLLLVTTGWLAIRLRRAEGVPSEMVRASRRLGGLLMVQIVLGVLALRHRDHVGVVTAHVAVGALFLAQAVWLAWQVRRGHPPTCLPRPADKNCCVGGPVEGWPNTSPQEILQSGLRMGPPVADPRQVGGS